jgi:hypothetical protein
MNASPRIRVAAYIVACATGVFAPAGFAKDDKPAPHPAVARDWTQFGRKESRRLDRDVYDEATRVRYVADRVALELDHLSVKPNVDAAGRAYATQTFGVGHSTIGACGHVSRSLKKALIGAGVEVRLLKLIVGEKPRRPVGTPDLSDIYNIDHAAVLYFSAKGPIVYDLWWAGREKGSYRRFPQSNSRGLPVSKWLTRMRGKNYTRFTITENPKLGDPIDEPLKRITELGEKVRAAP